MSAADESLNRQWQYTAYFALAAVALILTIVLVFSPGEVFRQFLGDTNPILIVLATTGIGALALWFLQSKYEFVIFAGRQTLRGVALSAVLATVLAVAIIIADFVIRYPKDLNVPPPLALLFYPAIGFVAEIVFHVVPLALLLLASTPLAPRLGKERVVWIAILLVAAAEPTYQVMFEGKPFTAAATYTWIHVFVIASLQLYVFRRYDFVSMLFFRLFYYAYWHILWGVVRLEVSF